MDWSAEAIERLLQDQELRTQMGNAARRTAETEFDWEHLIDQLEAFYQRIRSLRTTHRPALAQKQKRG